MSDIKLPSNLPPWVQGHMERYVDSGGAEGHMWDSSVVPGGLGPIATLLLMAVGRRSGTILPLPLLYGKTGDDYVIVASKGGRPKHPAWYLNLLAANRRSISKWPRIDFASARARRTAPSVKRCGHRWSRSTHPSSITKRRPIVCSRWSSSSAYSCPSKGV